MSIAAFIHAIRGRGIKCINNRKVITDIKCIGYDKNMEDSYDKNMDEDRSSMWDVSIIYDKNVDGVSQQGGR